jgi:hypothetical protein
MGRSEQGAKRRKPSHIKPYRIAGMPNARALGISEPGVPALRARHKRVAALDETAYFEGKVMRLPQNNTH